MYGFCLNTLLSCHGLARTSEKHVETMSAGWLWSVHSIGLAMFGHNFLAGQVGYNSGCFVYCIGCCFWAWSNLAVVRSECVLPGGTTRPKGSSYFAPLHFWLVLLFAQRRANLFRVLTLLKLWWIYAGVALYWSGWALQRLCSDVALSMRKCIWVI